MKQFHWLLCVAKNCDWSRKITPLSNVTGASLPVESKLNCELRNLQILKKKCWKNRQFLSSKQPCELNSLNVALDIAGVEKSQLRKFTVAINTGGHSIRVLNKRSVSVGGNLCPLWLEILKSL